METSELIGKMENIKQIQSMKSLISQDLFSLLEKKGFDHYRRVRAGPNCVFSAISFALMERYMFNQYSNQLEEFYKMLEYPTITYLKSMYHKNKELVKNLVLHLKRLSKDFDRRSGNFDKRNTIEENFNDLNFLFCQLFRQMIYEFSLKNGNLKLENEQTIDEKLEHYYEEKESILQDNFSPSSIFLEILSILIRIKLNIYKVHHLDCEEFKSFVRDCMILTYTPEGRNSSINLHDETISLLKIDEDVFYILYSQLSPSFSTQPTASLINTVTPRGSNIFSFGYPNVCIYCNEHDGVKIIKSFHCNCKFHINCAYEFIKDKTEGKFILTAKESKMCSLKCKEHNIELNKEDFAKILPGSEYKEKLMNYDQRLNREMQFEEGKLLQLKCCKKEVKVDSFAEILKKNGILNPHSNFNQNVPLHSSLEENKAGCKFSNNYQPQFIDCEFCNQPMDVDDIKKILGEEYEVELSKHCLNCFNHIASLSNSQQLSCNHWICLDCLEKYRKYQSEFPEQTNLRIDSPKVICKICNKESFLNEIILHDNCKLEFKEVIKRLAKNSSNGDHLMCNCHSKPISQRLIKCLRDNFISELEWIDPQIKMSQLIIFRMEVICHHFGFYFRESGKDSPLFIRGFIGSINWLSQNSIKNIKLDFVPLPMDWNLQQNEKKRYITLNETSDIYQRIKKDFLKTVKGKTIRQIRHIQNRKLFTYFECYKKKIGSMYLGHPSKYLFHSCKYINPENQFHGRGFEIQKYKKSKWGKSPLFYNSAKDADKNAYSSKGIKCIVFCEVVTGNIFSCKKNSSLTAPRGYHSVSNSDLSIFTIYHNYAAYPIALIEYK